MATMFEGTKAKGNVDLAPVSWEQWKLSVWDADTYSHDGKAYSTQIVIPIVGPREARGEVEIINAFFAREVRVNVYDNLTGALVNLPIALSISQANDSWFGQPCEVGTLTQRFQLGWPLNPAREIPATTRLQVWAADMLALLGAPAAVSITIMGTEPKLRQFPVRR